MHDDKNWTWVLERACDECGYASDSVSRDQLGARTRAVAGQWRDMLGRGTIVALPPHGETRSWSILEYGCHVRDVFDLFGDRLRTMVKKRKPPTFKDWDQERAAEKGDYANQDPAKVAYELASNAGKIADLLDRLDDDEWAKQGTRSDGVMFSVESLTRYLLHDVEHHLYDAAEILNGQ